MCNCVSHSVSYWFSGSFGGTNGTAVKMAEVSSVNINMEVENFEAGQGDDRGTRRGVDAEKT